MQEDHCRQAKIAVFPLPFAEEDFQRCIFDVAIVVVMAPAHPSGRHAVACDLTVRAAAAPAFGAPAIPAPRVGMTAGMATITPIQAMAVMAGTTIPATAVATVPATRDCRGC